MDRNGFAPILVIAALAIVLIIGGVWYYASHSSTFPQVATNQIQSSVSTSSTGQTTTPPNVNASTTTTPPSTSSTPAPQAITRGDNELVLLTLTGGQTITPGQSYSIKWSYSPDLLYYTSKVRICLLGLSNAGTTTKDVYILDLGNVIPAISAYNDGMCTYMSGSISGSYLIASTTIVSGSYVWTVPTDIASRFTSTPDTARIELIAFDERPAPTSTGPGPGGEWEGAVGWSESASSLIFAK